MWLSTTLGVSWPELTLRLARTTRLQVWGQLEPALAKVGEPSELLGATAAGADPRRSDAVLGALVRIAAVDGGDDVDAALTVAHLLRPGLTVLRNRLTGAGIVDADALVVGQAMIQIRSFPWQRRTRAHAANILRDTNKALAREFSPAWSGREVLVDPCRYDRVCDLSADLVSDRDQSLARGLEDLLFSVQQSGAVDRADIELLLDYMTQRSQGGAAHARVAAARGISVRTCKRHCAVALAALRAAGPEYLAA